MTMPNTQTNIPPRAIMLRGRDYDRRLRAIVVTRETETDWYGWPLDNPKCPVLQWPKFAWEVVEP